VPALQPTRIRPSTGRLARKQHAFSAAGSTTASNGDTVSPFIDSGESMLFRPDGPALHCDRVATTFSELADEAVRFAAYLATEVSAQVTGRGVMLAGSARRCAPAEFHRCGRCADGAGINTRNCTCCRCRRDQSPHDDDVSANNDPLPPSIDDHIRRLSVRLRVRTVGDEPALT
jgi:hypothetical protein